MKNTRRVLFTVTTVLSGMSTASLAFAGALTIPNVQSLNTKVPSVQIVKSPAERAKEFLLSSAAELNLQDGLSDLKVESITETAVGSHIRFAQVQNGFNVDGAGIVVTVGKDNDILSYTSDYSPAGTASKATPRFDIPQANAIQIAHDSLKLTASPTRETVIQKMMVVNGQSHPVYQINLAAPIDKKWSWEVVVDASSGFIYRSETKAYDVAATGTVFDPNPTIKTGKAYGTVTGYTDNNNADSPFFDSMLTPVKFDIDGAKGGVYSLTGKYVKITDQETPKNADCTSKSANLSVKRGDKCFSDVTAYYFISKSLAYLNETLGIKAGPMAYTGPFHVDPHGLDNEDNSHYDGQSDEIAFGDGGVPDAQDHDVLHHELGHAIHNWVTKGHLSQVEGLSEGIGDYWAASYSRALMKKGDVAYNWTFSYDGHNPFWPGRVVNMAGKYPLPSSTEIHDAGQMWATVCIEIWDVIGKEKMDKAFWSGIAMLSSNSSQLDAAKAVYAAAKKLYASDAATVKAVHDKFVARGYKI